jgi:hypothetical protein
MLIGAIELVLDAGLAVLHAASATTRLTAPASNVDPGLRRMFRQDMRRGSSLSSLELPTW